MTQIEAQPSETPVQPDPAADPMQRSQSARPARVVARRQAWSDRLRHALLLLLGLAVAGAIAWAWLPKPVPVDLAVAQHQRLTLTVDEDGRARVKNRYIVSSPLFANVARIELSPGDAVSPGTVLARLVPLQPPLLDARTKSEAQARVAAATASRRQASSTVARVRTALEFAGKESARQRALVGSGATSALLVERAELQEHTSREELASAEFGARVATYDLEMAQAALSRLARPSAGEQEQLEVTSPVKGRVLKVIQESEGVVQPGAPLLEIGDPSALEIVVDVLTSDAVHVRPGASASIERWGGERPLEAHVRLIEPSAFTRVSALGVEEQRVNVVLDLDGPQASWAALGDGYRVDARIMVWQADRVLCVPASTAFRRDEGWAVFKVEHGSAALTSIELGHVNADTLEVQHGLAAGDQVVMYPSDSVRDGVRIEARRR
jgi:HlyD family secretion protein